MIFGSDLFLAGALETGLAFEIVTEKSSSARTNPADRATIRRQ